MSSRHQAVRGQVVRLGPAAQNGPVGAEERQSQVNGRRAERYPRKLPIDCTLPNAGSAPSTPTCRSRNRHRPSPPGCSGSRIVSRQAAAHPRGIGRSTFMLKLLEFLSSVRRQLARRNTLISRGFALESSLAFDILTLAVRLRFESLISSARRHIWRRRI